MSGLELGYVDIEKTTLLKDVRNIIDDSFDKYQKGLFYE